MEFHKKISLVKKRCKRPFFQACILKSLLIYSKLFVSILKLNNGWQSQQNYFECQWGMVILHNRKTTCCSGNVISPTSPTQGTNLRGHCTIGFHWPYRIQLLFPIRAFTRKGSGPKDNIMVSPNNGSSGQYFLSIYTFRAIEWARNERVFHLWALKKRRSQLFYRECLQRWELLRIPKTRASRTTL